MSQAGMYVLACDTSHVLDVSHVLYVCWPELYAFQRNIVKADEMAGTGIFASACTFPTPGGRDPTTSTALFRGNIMWYPNKRIMGYPNKRSVCVTQSRQARQGTAGMLGADRVFGSIQHAGRTFRPGRIVRRHNMPCRCPPTVEESVTCPSRTLDEHAPLRHHEPHSLPRRRRPPTGRPRPPNRPLGPTRHRPHPAP